MSNILVNPKECLQNVATNSHAGILIELIKGNKHMSILEKAPRKMAVRQACLLTLLLLLGVYWLQTDSKLYADMDPEYRKQLETGEVRERQVEGYFDMQYNRVSNIQFTVHNNGRTFYDSKLQRLTGIWPRGSVNGYVFGGGIWVGTKKRHYKRVWDPAANDSAYVYLPDSIRATPKWDWENPVIVDGKITTVNMFVQYDTIKRREIDTTRENKLVDVTYQPKTARSYMAPGRVEDGDPAMTNNVRSYRVYFSMDYNAGTGEPLLEESGPAWPIWDDLSADDKILKYDRYFGHYIKDETRRNTSNYPKGPAFISGEDMFATYKDTDLSYFNDLGSVGYLYRKGYPLRIQYEQMIYSWGFGDYRDFIFIKYDQINKNTDTLWDMWLAPLFDVDIGLITDGGNGAYNDYTCFYGMEDKGEYPNKPDSIKAMHNMAYQYSASDRGEGGKGFGYVGFVFLESPATIGQTVDFNPYANEGENPVLTYTTDSTGFVRKDGTWIRTDPNTGLLDTCQQLNDGTWMYGYDANSKQWKTESNPVNMKHVPWYPVEEQLGLVTFRNWPQAEDKTNDNVMYDFMSYNELGGTDGRPGSYGDLRYLMATGPFHMRPNDTARTVVGLVIASPGKGGDADGTDEDLAELVRKTEFMQRVYDENFRAPQPPSAAVITSWEPLNNGMVIRWDSTSELSSDPYEKGMAFLGYTIYRARRLNLDTFDVNDVEGNSVYPGGKGPFGWKELVTYTMPAPYLKSVSDPPYVVGTGPNAQQYLGIDSLIPIGPYYRENTETGEMEVDPKNILCVRVPQGVVMYPQSLLWAAIEMSRLGVDTFSLLKKSGWYDDETYGKRITAVVSAIDSSNYPWGNFYYKKNNFDLNDKALFGNPHANGSFLWDSIMFCRVELNVALARINPLFYKEVRVRISDATKDSFLVKVDTNGIANEGGKVLKEDAHWVTHDSLDAEGNIVYDEINGKQVPIVIPDYIDTLYDISSIQRTEVSSGSYWTINCLALRGKDMETIYAEKDWLKDTVHANLVRDSLYKYFKLGWVRNIFSADFGGGGIYPVYFSSSDMAKNEVIIPHMKEITNNRTFIDIGDDPEPGSATGNAYISEVDDPRRTERLLNNVEYYYKVVSFDEGDFLQPTPMKYNVGLEGLPNLVETYPASDRPASPLKFDVIGTEGDLGGVFNYQLFSVDEERASKLFAGDTIEVEFIPSAVPTSSLVLHRFPEKDSAISAPVGLYTTDIRITNVTKDVLLFSGNTRLEATPCSYTDATTWVDNTMYRTGTDTITQASNVFPYSDIGRANSRQAYDAMNVHFTTGDFREPGFCYSIAEENMMWGNLGFSFDAGLKQYGGIYRGDSVDMMGLDQLPGDEKVSTVVTPLSAVGSSWEDETWYLDSARRNWDLTDNRIPLIGNIYGARVVEDVSFKETDTIELNSLLQWLGIQTPPRSLGPWIYPSTSYTAYQLARFDNGPGVYEIEFLPGGEETLSIQWGSGGLESKEFKVKYLNINVRDLHSYKRYAPEKLDVDSVDVSYSPEIEPYELPVKTDIGYIASRAWICRTPHPANLAFKGVNPNEFYRKYNLYATGYVNGRARTLTQSSLRNRFATDDAVIQKEGLAAEYIGKQNRYYLTGYSEDGDTLDFVHTINIAGAQWVLSYLRRGYRTNGTSEVADQYTIVDGILDSTYKQDFKANQKIRLLSWGGVSGFPAKGAKIKFAVSNPYTEYTDDLMEQVTVVPNPYIITHQAQASPYGAEVYFTKLPPVCDIDIFTAAGDLITSVKHNEIEDGTRKSIAIYDLLTKNGQRVQSQTLVALIKAPNGAMTTKHFSVIVGGFRIVD